MTTKDKFILAVDGGGTKTQVLIADLKGKVVGRGKSGPMSLAATTEAHAIESLLEAVSEAAKAKKVEFSKVVIGMAGVDTDEEVEHASKLFLAALKKKYTVGQLLLVNDVVTALESGTSNPNAIVLISGTGSNCFGRNAKGETVKTGGMDFLLSDQGSGYDIGQKVLRAVIKAYDGRGIDTIMEKLVCQHFKIKDLSKLKDKVYHPILNKTQIGQLAKICFEAQEHQDTVANEIINIAIDELMSMVSTVIRRLQLMHTHTDLVLVGSIATDPYMRKQLNKLFTSRFSKLKIIVPDEPPVAGALKLAIQLI